jgi:hypothetical protein
VRGVLKKILQDFDNTTAQRRFAKTVKSLWVFRLSKTKQYGTRKSIMQAASKIIGFICAILTIILWGLTFSAELTPGSIGTAVSLTAIVAVAGLLSLQYRS